jgi:hypothetical protein
MKGFDPQWCKLIKDFVQGDSVGIRVNDDIGHYFHKDKVILFLQFYLISWQIC